MGKEMPSGEMEPQENKYEKPPEGACPNGEWMVAYNARELEEPIWVHNATCGCEKETGKDPYTGEDIE